MSEVIPYNWDDEDMCFMDDAEEDDDECAAGIPCRYCSCLIGNEVGFGDDWSEGPICENCMMTSDV
jgi:hypothetical protein